LVINTQGGLKWSQTALFYSSGLTQNRPGGVQAGRPDEA